MYESFYGFKEKPFSLLPDPRFLLLTKKHRAALTMLEYGLDSDAGFIVVTGEIGAGKTTLIRKFIRREDPDVTLGLVNNTQCSDSTDLLRWIAFSFGLEFEGQSYVVMYETFVKFLIQEYAESRRVVIIIDEAQRLGIELLEQVRLLSNINMDDHLLVQFILVGQPELRDQLREPELEQFAQRILVDYHLGCLSIDETIEYIRHRLVVAGGEPDVITEKAMRVVWQYSRGVPRLINVICDTALVYCFAEQKSRVNEKLMEEVVRDKEQGLAPVHQESRCRPSPSS